MATSLSQKIHTYIFLQKHKKQITKFQKFNGHMVSVTISKLIRLVEKKIKF